MRKFYRFLAAAVSAAVVASMGPALYLQDTLPDTFTVTSGEELQLSSQYDYITCENRWDENCLTVYGSENSSYTAQLRLMGLVKIKDVTIRVADEQDVAICGVPFGIKMTTDGVMVVGTGSVQTENGPVSPAKAAGIREGDLLLSVNGQTTLSNSIIAQLVQQSNGSPISISYQREEEKHQTVLTPALSVSDGRWHIGLWVRDSSAGIGTLTFCDPTSGAFGGLGHAICDVDTGQLMPLSQGEVVHASITGLLPGMPGEPGELQGAFCGSEVWGVVERNCPSGIFGEFCSDWSDFPLISTAHSQEVKEGPAKMLCTISGTEPRYYDVEIERIHSYDDQSGRNLILHITDEELLCQTGGILQGMSGSPLVQNGKLIGAVTHVFVNDPTRGYGIFIDTMLNSME